MSDRFTVDDVIRAGGCPMGIRRWFASHEGDLPAGLTLKSFLREGMSIETARGLRDGFVNRALALKEADNGRKQ